MLNVKDVPKIKKIKLKVKHENIIELVDVFGHVSSVSIVMDFMDTDLEVTEKSLPYGN